MDGATPKYQQIVDHLKEAIAAGRYAAGQKLPSEHELVKTFETSRAASRCIPLRPCYGVTMRGRTPAPGLGPLSAVNPPETGSEVNTLRSETPPSLSGHHGHSNSAPVLGIQHFRRLLPNGQQNLHLTLCGESGFHLGFRIHSALVLNLHCTEPGRGGEMTTIVIVLLVLFLLGGGGWGYTRWRG